MTGVRVGCTRTSLVHRVFQSRLTAQLVSKTTHTPFIAATDPLDGRDTDQHVSSWLENSPSPEQQYQQVELVESDDN